MLLERYRLRGASGERHPGHQDQLRAAEWDEARVRAQCEPLAIGGQVVEVDTTHLEALDHDAILARVDEALHLLTRPPSTPHG